MRYFIPILLLILVFGCGKLNKHMPTKADSSSVFESTKANFFWGFKAAKWTRIDVQESDSLIELKHYPTDDSVDVTKLGRELGTYSIMKKSLYFADLNNDEEDDALVKLSFIPVQGNGSKTFFGVLLKTDEIFRFVDIIEAGSHCTFPHLTIDTVFNQVVYMRSIGFKQMDSCCCPSDTTSVQYVLIDNCLVKKAP